MLVMPWNVHMDMLHNKTVKNSLSVCLSDSLSEGPFNSYTTVCCPKIKGFVLKSPDPRRTDQEVRFKGVLQELATGYFLHAKNG